MYVLRLQIIYVIALSLVASRSSNASEDTIGANGINSIGLGLNGTGIDIGQVEPGRPGKHGFDTGANCCNDKIIPTDVFARDMQADDGEGLSDHAMWVAGVMISKQTMVPTPPPVHSPPVGVAQSAALYSSAFLVLPMGNLQADAAVAAQHVAALTTADVRAINMSFGVPLDSSSNMFDGNSTMTQFVDWSSNENIHETLYVVAGNETGKIGVPVDNFNGITVAYSAKEPDGVFRRVGLDNDYNEDPVGAGTFTDIIAPGDRLDLAGPNGTFAPLPDNIGTSFAAPHVTGTVALLQQHAESRIPAANWDADARRHQVMKAVLMNSADKIKDDGMLGAPGAFLGMERTVVERIGNDTWLNSSAFSDDSIPLDREMGTGHLNAKRAFTQFATGETPVGDFVDQSVNVPAIGWDFNASVGTFNKYVIQGNLTMGHYVAITLAWDRNVNLLDDEGTVGAFDEGDTFTTTDFDNLDLHLVPAGTTDLNTATWKESSTAGPEESSVEHIFAQIPATGLYEIWVQNSNELFSAGSYALAWWLAPAPTSGTSQGDYDGNGSIEPEDYNIWRASFGSANLAADGNGNGIVDAADYVVWREHLGQMVGSGSLSAVPEPASGLLLTAAGALLSGRFGSRRRAQVIHLN